MLIVKLSGEGEIFVCSLSEVIYIFLHQKHKINPPSNTFYTLLKLLIISIEHITYRFVQDQITVSVGSTVLCKCTL